jgi:hypothetical protein
MTENTIDQLMELDPLELSDQNIEEIIEYQRKMQANFELGIKPKKPDGPKLSLDKILGQRVEVPKKEGIRRRA